MLARASIHALRRISFTEASLAAALMLASAFAESAPVGGQVTSGAGAVSQGGPITTVTQSTQNLSLNWKGFNVGSQETVNFVQPSQSAIAVNRILDTNGSQILGRLNANGQIYLLNPNGILFGQGAQVNVGGLVASTLDLNDASASAASRTFGGPGAGSVINRGVINAASGGFVALLGNRVVNDGTITAPFGTVALGAGSAATLTFSGNSLVRMQVDQGVLDSAAENGGLIRADGGKVLLSAGAKNELLASVVNNTGIVEARTVENREGTIILLGGMTMGTVNVSGTLDASAPAGGNGGFIETSAARVKVAVDAQVTTAAARGRAGTWLVDPVDFTIAAAGGDISGAALSANLGGGNVTIQSTSGGAGTAGDVNVNDVVSWSANKLTLNAQNNINVTAGLNGSGTANLALEYGQGAVAAGNTSTVKVNAPVNLPAGSNFSRKLGSDGALVGYTSIASLGAPGSTTGTDLQGMSGNLAGHYALGADIDASATSAWNAGAGFAPIGDNVSPFAGTFDGLGHTINGVFINRPAANFVGPFGYIGSTAGIGNAGLTGVDITGMNYVGGLAGYNNGGSISRSYATGRVVGALYTGGLVGVHKGSISDSYATASVNGSDIGPGGLVGYSIGTINNSYATGQVAGGSFYSGGLVGVNRGRISNSYATGTVHGANHAVGGLVGINGQFVGDNASISNSYATGAVSGSQNDVGGLVGDNYTSISNSYATGTVSGSAQDVGGLVGIQYGGSISQSYAAGAVTGPNAPGSIGGLVGRKNAGTNDSSYWDTYSTGQSGAVGGLTDAGVAAVTSSPTQSAAANYAYKQGAYPGLDFTSPWMQYQTFTYPLLRSLMTPLTVTANSPAKTYDGLAYSGTNGVTYSVAPNGNLFGTVSYADTSQGAINTGSYSITPSGQYSNQQGYLISYAGGALTIDPAPLTVTANAASRAYRATEPAFSGSVTGFMGTDTLSSATAGTEVFTSNALASSNVGSYGITGSGLTANNGNYTFVQAVGNATALTINPATLTVTANAASRLYGASEPAFSGNVTGFVAGDTLLSATTGAQVFSTNALVGSNVGAYGITGAGLTANNGNYTFVQAPANSTALTITPAVLTVTANAANRLYGATEPAFSGSISGFVAGDTLISATTGTEVFSTNALPGSIVGAYGILGAGLLSNAGNYTFNQAAGNATALTINALPVTLDPIALPIETPIAPVAAPAPVVFASAADIISAVTQVASDADSFSEEGQSGAGRRSARCDGNAGPSAKCASHIVAPRLLLIRGGLRLPADAIDEEN